MTPGLGRAEPTQAGPLWSGEAPRPQRGCPGSRTLGHWTEKGRRFRLRERQAFRAQERWWPQCTGLGQWTVQAAFCDFPWRDRFLPREPGLVM